MPESLLRKLCHVAVLFAVLVAGHCVAQEAKGPEQRFTAGATTYIWNNFPFTRLYPEFTAGEKAIFHAWYENIAPGDEPPYPTVNMETLSSRFGEKLERYGVSGKVKFLLQIDAEGKVTSFSNLGSSNPAVAQFNMLVLRDVRFKPAKCGGKPCAMDFPWFYTIVPNGI